MSSLQHKLFHFEVPPPASVWPEIASRLDEEFVAPDIALATRLNDVEMPPPPSAWTAISASLDAGATPVVDINSRPRVSRLFKKIAVAALLAGTVAVAALYFNSGENLNTPAPQAAIPSPAQPGNTGPADNQSADSNASPENVSPEREETQNDPPVLAARSQRNITRATSPNNAGRQARRLPRPERESSDIAYYASGNIEQAGIDAVQTVMAIEPVTVSAPPIRDSRGNIIMDLNVIHVPGQQYIVVTGPNGNQTKISSKFLHCLSYLNSDFPNAEANADEQQCRSMFRLWRDKFLSDASFIPAASNFFDIFEMKEMIQER